jgi:hypothetical protein
MKRTIRVYNQVFRIEKTVYSIQGINLPQPVSYRQMAFFIGSLLVMIVLNAFPPVNMIDLFLVKFVGIPFLVAWFFTRKTLDGKAPHRFIARYIEHKLSNHQFARYKNMEKRKKYQYDGVIAYRIHAGGDPE